MEKCFSSARSEGRTSSHRLDNRRFAAIEATANVVVKHLGRLSLFRRIGHVDGRQQSRVKGFVTPAEIAAGFLHLFRGEIHEDETFVDLCYTVLQSAGYPQFLSLDRQGQRRLNLARDSNTVEVDQTAKGRD